MENAQPRSESDAAAEIVGLEVRSYPDDITPNGMRFRTRLKPFVIDPVATGIPTGTPGIGVTITGGGDTDDPIPDHDPGGDPPS